MGARQHHLATLGREKTRLCAEQIPNLLEWNSTGQTGGSRRGGRSPGVRDRRRHPPPLLRPPVPSRPTHRLTAPTALPPAGALDAVSGEHRLHQARLLPTTAPGHVRGTEDGGRVAGGWTLHWEVVREEKGGGRRRVRARAAASQDHSEKHPAHLRLTGGVSLGRKADGGACLACLGHAGGARNVRCRCAHLRLTGGT